MQAVSTVHIWSLGQQILSFKTLAGRTTTLDTKLFAIRLSTAKATSIAIEHIILIINSLGSTRQAVNPSVYPKQAYFLAVCSVLRLFFSQNYSYRIDFWDCSSKAEWFLHQLVHNNVTNIRVAARLYLATSINFLYFKSVISYLDTWRTLFNHPTIQGWYFFSLRDRNQWILQPSYAKDSSWLSHIGQSVTLYTRITRAILNYASIREYRQYFFLAKCIQCPYGHCQVETQ